MHPLRSAHCLQSLRAACSLGEPRAIEAALEELAGAKPDPEPVLAGTALLVEAGHAAAARQLLHTTLDCDAGAVANDERLWLRYFELANDTLCGEDLIARHREALTRCPGSATLHYNAGVLLLDAGQPGDAEVHATRAVELDPSSPAALRLLRNVYFSSARYHEAIACSELMRELGPLSADDCRDLAMLLVACERVADAVAVLREAIALDPDNARLRYDAGEVLLKLGLLEQGFEYYRARWSSYLAHEHKAFDLPAWRRPGRGREKVLAWCEQGIGDQLMAAGLLDELAGQVGQLSVEVDGRLLWLLRRSFPSIEFQAKPEADQEFAVRGGFDAQLPLMDVIASSRTSLADFPAPRAYLVADPRRVAYFRARYDRRFPGLRRVGVSWRGGHNAALRERRSIPLPLWLPLARLADVQLINLQYGAVNDELEDLDRLHGVRIYHDAQVDPLRDLEDQAAQIAALDGVVTIDNTTAHLAGGLGKPVINLLPVGAEWRWFLNRDEAVWYPRMRLVRQRVVGQWEAVMERAVQLLSEPGTL